MGPDSRPSMAIGIVQDVTGRHEARCAVEQCQDRFDGVVAAIAGVAWVADPDGVGVETLSWQALTGQGPEANQGMGWLLVVHQDDRERVSATWRCAVADGALYDVDYRILCADGVSRWFNTRAAPIRNRDGTIREWIGVCLPLSGEGRTADALPGGLGLPAPRAITAAQIRAARGMACLSAEELARRARVSVSTVRRLEDGNATVQPRPDTVRAVRQVLEQSGIAFTFDACGRPGVREA